MRCAGKRIAFLGYARQVRNLSFGEKQRRLTEQVRRNAIELAKQAATVQLEA